MVLVLQSGWKSGFMLHNPGGGHGPQGSPLQSVPKIEQRQASVVVDGTEALKTVAIARYRRVRMIDFLTQTMLMAQL